MAASSATPSAPRPGGAKIVLIAPFDDALHAHSALKHRALQRLGCHVVAIDRLHRPGLLERLRGGSPLDRLRRSVEQARPDLVLVADDGGLGASTIAALRRETASVWAAWPPGDLRALDWLRDMAPAYDRIFVSGTDLIPALTAPGLPPVSYLPLGCDPSVHRPMRARDQFRANVVFAGTATPRREALLSELVEFGLAIWGPGWRKTVLRDYCRGELLAESDYVRAYAGASVAINIHQADGRAEEAGINQRTFELAAIGAPQVVDYRLDLERHFELGREVRAFQTPGELKAAVQELIHDPSRAEVSATAARRRALAEHTYMHRMAELMGQMGR